MNVFTQLVALVGRITPEAINLLGTAFLVRSDGLYATTAHVVGSDDSGLVVLAPHINDINTYQDLNDLSCLPNDASIVEIDPIRDIALISTTATFSGNMPPLGTFDTCSVGESVHIFGFPHCTQGRRALTYQRAEIGAKVILGDQGVTSRHAVINSQARPGQSGSMVFSEGSASVVGMLVGAWARPSGVIISGINPNELHQTTHCVSAHHIRQMI